MSTEVRQISESIKPARQNEGKVMMEHAQYRPPPQQIHQVSEASLLRKSSCNYLRSAVSPTGNIALVVVNGVRIFTYSEISGGVMDTFTAIRLPKDQIIRDIAWSPLGWSSQDELAICFEDRLEVWTRFANENSFSVQHVSRYGKKIPGILHVIWDSGFPHEIYVCCTTMIHAISLLPHPTNTDPGASCFRLLRSFKSRHSGGFAVASGNLLTADSYQEIMGTFDLLGVPASEDERKVPKVVLERCRPPLSLTPQEVEQYEDTKYYPSCTVGCNNWCFLSFEPAIRVLSTHHSSSFDSTSETRLGLAHVRIPSSSHSDSLFSVVSSSSIVSESDDVTDVLKFDNRVASGKIKSKTRGAFPHSTNSSLAETLSISENYSGIENPLVMPSTLEALQTISSREQLSDNDSIQNIKKTGLICAAKISTGHCSSMKREKEIEWVGSALTVTTNDYHGKMGRILRPDILAAFSLDIDGDTSRTLLAVSSTQSNQITLFLAVHCEAENKMNFQEIDSYYFPDEARCKGLVILPRRSLEGRSSSGVTVVALVAQCKARPMASESTSACYETSIVSYGVPKDAYFKWKLPRTDVESKKKQTNENSEKFSETSLSDVVRLLSQMKLSLEDRLGKLEEVVTKQGKKMDHLQSSVDHLLDSAR